MTRSVRSHVLGQMLGKGDLACLHIDHAELLARTSDIYPDEHLDGASVDRFVIIERLELPGEEAFIASAWDSLDSVASRVAQLLGDVGESSWNPVAVLDLDHAEELQFKLALTLTRDDGSPVRV